jgi:hypothetical protein
MYHMLLYAYVQSARNPKIDFQLVKSMLPVEKYCEKMFVFGWKANILEPLELWIAWSMGVGYGSLGLARFLTSRELLNITNK